MTAGPIVLVDDLTAYQAGDPQYLIDAATTSVRNYCRWHVTPSITETVTVDGDGSTILGLRTLHLTAVSSLTVDGVPLDPSTYRWSQVGQVMKTSGAPWYESVAVTFTHGYDVAPDVAAVILAAASRAQASPSGVVRTQTAQVSETYSQTGFNQVGGVALFDSEKATLDLYRLPPRP